jgi:tetratricopeptide (TPR) repeat protein
VPVKRLKKTGVLLVPLVVTVALAAADNPGGELLSQADELRLRGAYEEALAYYEQVLAEDPASPAAWAGAAASLEALDEGRALAVLAEALGEPKAAVPPSALAVLADGWARRGAIDKAMKLLANEAAEGTGRYYLVRGEINLARGDLPGAIKEFKKARAAGDAAAPYYLAEALLGTGHYDEAELYLDEFLDVFPYVAQAKCARAEIYLRRGENESAVHELRDVLALDRNNRRALFDLAAVAAARGDYGEAIRRYGDLVALDPGDRRAFYLLAKTYEYVDPPVAAQKMEEYRRRFE